MLAPPRWQPERCVMFTRRGLMQLMWGSTWAGASMCLPHTVKAEEASGTSYVGDVFTRRLQARLQEELSDEINTYWMQSIDVEIIEPKTIVLSVPLKFVRKWLVTHHQADLERCCRLEFGGNRAVVVELRGRRKVSAPDQSRRAETT